MKNHCLLFKNSKGFTLIEIAIVMVIIGTLAGAGISMMGTLTKRKARNETLDYLKQVRESLVSFTNSQGRLPMPDTDNDGQEDPCTLPDCVGTLPFVDLNVNPLDPYKRVLRYEISNVPEVLITDRPTSCTELRGWNPVSASRPLIVDADDPGATPVAVAAILISSGPMDADGDGNVFDAVTSGTWQGNNTAGNPNYIRYPPTNTFDDLVMYIGGFELYQGMECSRYDLCSSGITIRNQSGGLLYYQQNGGACSSWPDNNDRVVLPSDSYEVFTDAGCGTAYSEPFINYSQQKEKVDINNDCLTGIQGGSFVDR